MSFQLIAPAVLLWITPWPFMVFVTASEVTLVNRNVQDSFRVGAAGCNNSNCPGKAICQSNTSLCLCDNGRPNFLNYNITSGETCECVTSESIQDGRRLGEECALGPFQAIPDRPNEQATEFTDQQQRNQNLTSCSLQKTLAKHPDKVIVEELKWLNESYVHLKVKNKALHFKWLKSVPELRGTIITFKLNCQIESGSYKPCLRAKVLGTWQPADSSVPKVPLTTKILSSLSTTSTTSKATSTIQITATTLTTERQSIFPTTLTPGRQSFFSSTAAAGRQSILSSTADADSDEYIIDSRLLNIILIALLAVSFIVNIVLIICTRRYWKKTRRMEHKNLKMKDLEMKDTDQHRKSRTGGDIEPYDEVVIRNGGIRNQGFYDKPVQSSADDNQAGRSKGEVNYEEPSYEPLRRNPLQDQKEEHKYESLNASSNVLPGHSQEIVV